MGTGTSIGLIVGLAILCITWLVVSAMERDAANTPQTAEERVFMTECLKHQNLGSCQSNLEEMRSWSSN